jgi:F420-0:gamma-glutamyl ligase-like protein
LRVKTVKTRYWRPGEDYLEAITRRTAKYLRRGCVLVLSEKALSTARGDIVDEALAKPGFLAKAIATFWMRAIWGYVLGPLCRFNPATLARLRSFPKKAGAAHKQVVLDAAGFLQALKYGSEGGIDLSNMPYAYACLPLQHPHRVARQIQEHLARETGTDVTVIIADTDSTFTFHDVHFTAHPNPLGGITSLGLGAFILGRALKMKQRATPLAVAGLEVTVEEALRLAEVAHHARGYGTGRTVWDMADRFNVDASDVSWEMLEEDAHYPLVLIRRR